MQEEDQDQVMELMWHNGQVVVHRPPRPPPPPQPQLPIYYIQEDEMALWLHQPLVDADHPFGHDFSSDHLYSAAPSAIVIDPTTQSPPPHPSPRPPTIRTDRDFRVQRFGHLTNFVSPPGPSNTIKDSASVVESNITPDKRTSESVGVVRSSGFVAGGSSSVGGGGCEVETLSFEVTAGTATDASLAELDLEPLDSDLKKRKAPEVDDIDYPSQDLAADTNKETQAPTAKRTRAVQVHNLSERRRRDRINEKMKALQELLPRCNKTDKASMLDDAFEYLKSLKMHVQMMSMGMVPMMFPGLQQYMQMQQPTGIGSGIDMNRPMMPFHMTTPTHLSPRFPEPCYNPSSAFLPTNPPSIQVTNPVSLTLHPDPYLSYQNSQMKPSQSGLKAQPSAEAIRDIVKD